MTVGQRIVQYREKAELKQSELADKVGITKQLLWKYETGRITNIPMDNLVAIANVLHVDPAVLAGWEEDTESEVSPYLEDLRSRPELRMLLDVSRGVTKENIEAVAKMMEGFHFECKTKRQLILTSQK